MFRFSIIVRALAALTAAALALGGCAAEPDPWSSPTPAAPSEALIDYLAFGDSWPHGAHCPCTPFPELIADGLETELGARVGFVDKTTNGGTSADLLADMQSNISVREEIAEAELIVVSTGANDMEPAIQAYARDECGGADELDCFRAIADAWRANFTGMLAAIDELRAGKPTAVMVLTNSNEFLVDPNLRMVFGPDFGLTGGAVITAMHHDALCEATATHGATCIDLRPVLNGPDFTTPQDVNTQDAMQLVADAVVSEARAVLGAG